MDELLEKAEKKKEYMKKWEVANRKRRKKYKQEYMQKFRVTHPEYIQEYYQANKDKIKQHQKQYQKANKERIKKYSLKYYLANKKKIKEYYRKNYQANKERIKEYKLSNKSKINQQRRKRYETNPEKKRYIQKWQAANPEKVKEYTRRTMQKKYSTPKGKINTSMSSGIRYSLKGNKNWRHWEKLVNFTIEDLIKHLEKQFTPEMTWENYGSFWHIDHIIPISVFNFNTTDDIDFKRCWALKNLQPLEAIENMKKHNKLDKPFQPAFAFNGFLYNEISNATL